MLFLSLESTLLLSYKIFSTFLNFLIILHSHRKLHPQSSRSPSFQDGFDPGPLPHWEFSLRQVFFEKAFRVFTTRRDYSQGTVVCLQLGIHLY